MPGVVVHRHLARHRAALGFRFLVLLGFAVFFALPVIWLVLAPTKSGDDLIFRSPLAIGSFHNVWLAWQQVDGLNDHIFWRWMENSLLYSLSATAITLTTAVPAGYGLAFGDFPGRKLILKLTLVAMIMPPATLVLPIFLELNAVHLIGSAFSIILPFAFFPFGVYLAYIYYITALPPTLLEAARVDGASELQTFLRIAMPLAKPVLALVFFFAFVSDWNNFFLPYVVLSDPQQLPITVGLQDLLASTPAFNPSVGGGGGATNIFKPELAIATVIAVLPVAVVFVASQRALVRGLVGGGVKE
jgi:multiple sugar transport system permease protein